jgi:hypothetical protein
MACQGVCSMAVMQALLAAPRQASEPMRMALALSRACVDLPLVHVTYGSLPHAKLLCIVNGTSAKLAWLVGRGREKSLKSAYMSTSNAVITSSEARQNKPIYVAKTKGQFPQSAVNVNSKLKTMITQDYQVVSPAYGRDYKNKTDAEAGFRSGKDFMNESPIGGTYCSIRDFAPGVKVEVRYNKKQSAVIVTV